MRGGRKAETVIVNAKEKAQTKWTPNFSVRARNLRKSELAGVIFGCKHSTIKECFKEELFGLPAPHFSYVRNIVPGLPLFLFNYSDRKLHGIFEAASHGRMNINPYGWTTDGSDTLYPAQVRVRIRMQCQPLAEDQFGSIISKNYYEPKLFWFELDQDQKDKLISMFLSVRITSSTPIRDLDSPKRMQRGESYYPNKENTGLGEEIWVSESGFVDESTENNEKGVGLMEPNKRPSFAAAVRGESSYPKKANSGLDVHSSPQKKWGSLFKDSTISDDQKGVEDTTMLMQGLNPCGSDQSNKEWDSYCFAPCSDENRMCLEAAAGDQGEVYKHVEENVSFAKSSSFDGITDNELKHDGKESTVATSEMDPSITAEWKSSCFEPDLVPESLADRDGEEIIDEEHVHFKSSVECISFSKPEAAFALEMGSSSVQSIVAKLVEEVGELKSSHSEQAKKICSLEVDLVESKSQIGVLKDRLNLLESRFCNESILIIGGFDDSTWLSSLDCYRPSQDVLESLCPLSVVRSHASAAKLNGEIYLFGGVDGVNGNVCHDKVELYNPAKNQWTTCSPLSQRKRNMAGVSFNDKIFAIGGGYRDEFLSEVELFDLDVRRWIPSRSMLQKRFAPAAVAINGAIYVAGGYDGRDFLKSVESFDPREYSWRLLEKSMSTKRAFHSLAILNEKIYAIGGYDGENIVSTVEVFDPRNGTWMMEESLKESRGYSSAVVLGDAIYMIGGLNYERKVLDSVECYKEGLGWQLIVSEAIGKRAFFSAVVMDA